MARNNNPYEHQMIAHAVNNEDDGQTGGAHGDQRGYELVACKWYKYKEGWTDVFRPKSSDKAEGIAQFMEDAVANGCIGYNQNRSRRKEFFDCVVNEKNLDVTRVDHNHSTDCCGLVYTAVYSQYLIPAVDVGEDKSGNDLFGIPTTDKITKYLMEDVGDFYHYPSDNTSDYAPGWEKLTPEKILDGWEHLERGDILLAEGHVAVWI